MIRVTPAPEPESFNATVRQPGLSAIAELVGEEPLVRRPGPRRKKRCDRRDDLKGEDFPPFWTAALDDLYARYHRICAYVSLYIEPVTGARSVDHMIPKSSAWDRVYEWTNYRLACPLMNSRKGAAEVVLDPFEVEDDWFGLEPVSYLVAPQPGISEDIRARVVDTIRQMDLNDSLCRSAREAYGEDFLSGEIAAEYLERRAPFVARELRRQGRFPAGDT